jgi:hypothetical protein
MASIVTYVITGGVFVQQQPTLVVAISSHLMCHQGLSQEADGLCSFSL